MSKDYWDKRWKEVLENEKILRLAMEARPDRENLSVFMDQLPPEGRILDYGCGCGRNSVMLVGEGFEVYAEDIAWGALTVLDQLLMELQLPAVTTRQSGGGTLDYPDNFFDGILAWSVLDHMTLKEGKNTVEEMSRTLKDRGCILASFDRADESYRADPHELLDDGTITYTEGKWSGMVFHPYEETAVRELFEDFGRIRFLPGDERSLKVIVRQ